MTRAAFPDAPLTAEEMTRATGDPILANGSWWDVEVARTTRATVKAHTEAEAEDKALAGDHRGEEEVDAYVTGATRLRPVNR